MGVQEKHQSIASGTSPTGELACSSGVCPDWEWNQQTFGLQDDAQPTEPHWSGSYFILSGIKDFIVSELFERYSGDIKRFVYQVCLALFLI